MLVIKLHTPSPLRNPPGINDAHRNPGHLNGKTANPEPDSGRN